MIFFLIQAFVIFQVLIFPELLKKVASLMVFESYSVNRKGSPRMTTANTIADAFTVNTTVSCTANTS